VRKVDKEVLFAVKNITFPLKGKGVTSRQDREKAKGVCFFLLQKGQKKKNASLLVFHYPKEKD